MVRASCSHLAELGLSAAILLHEMFQLVVDVLLSAAHLLQSLPDIVLQLVQVALRRQGGREPHRDQKLGLQPRRGSESSRFTASLVL